MFNCSLLSVYYKTEWNYLFQTKDPGKDLTTIESICSSTFQIRTWTGKYCSCSRRKNRLDSKCTYTKMGRFPKESITITVPHMPHSKKVLKYASSRQVSYLQNVNSISFSFHIKSWWIWSALGCFPIVLDVICFHSS